MNKYHLLLFLFLIPVILTAQSIRQPVDTVGFAVSSSQMDIVIERINRSYESYFDSVDRKNKIDDGTALRLAVCPHDDYTYAGFLYESVLSHIRAKTVIIFGVAHKARKFNVEQKLVFDSFDEWKEPCGNIKASLLREAIMRNLPEEDYIIHDSLQQAEHSVEALVPFLQYHDHDVKIIPVLVPHMDFPMMEKYAQDLAASLQKVMQENHLQWGKDIALVISNDAVHYGDEDWGGQNYATYGTDQSGYEKAVAHEHELIQNSLMPAPDTATAHKFFSYTVQPSDWHAYQWPWCGRYSVPFGLLTGMYLGQMTGKPLSKGIFFGYATSISHPALPVEDLKMGKTAIATLRHWVGYAAVGYR